MTNLAFCYCLSPILHGLAITPMTVWIGEVRLVCLQSECKQTLFDSAALQGHFRNILPRVCRGLNLSGINSYRYRSNIFWKLNHWSAQTKIVSEYDQEIPQSQTADNPVAPRGRAAQPSRDTRKTN